LLCDLTLVVVLNSSEAHHALAAMIGPPFASQDRQKIGEQGWRREAFSGHRR
jgi:hypothetical protein